VRELWNGGVEMGSSPPQVIVGVRPRQGGTEGGFFCSLCNTDFEAGSWEQHVNDLHHTSALKAVNRVAGVTMSIPQSSTLTPRALLDLPVSAITRNEPTTTLSKRRTGTGMDDAVLGVGGARSLAKLPAGWVQLWSRTKSRPYFKNTVTNKCSWTLPGSATSHPLGPGATTSSLHEIIIAPPAPSPGIASQTPMVVGAFDAGGNGGLHCHEPPGERDEPMDMLDDSPKMVLHVNGQCFGHAGALKPQEEEGDEEEEERDSINSCKRTRVGSAPYSYSCGCDRQQSPACDVASQDRDLHERVQALESDVWQSDIKLAKVLASQDALTLQLHDIQGKLAIALRKRHT